MRSRMQRKIEARVAYSILYRSAPKQSFERSVAPFKE